MVEQEAGAALGRAWLAAGTASRSWLSCASEISAVPKQRARLGPAATRAVARGRFWLLLIRSSLSQAAA